MFTHRFLHQLRTASVVPVSAVCPEAPFVACSALLALAPNQQAMVQAVYRIAAERANAQLRAARRRSRVPQFSVN